MSFYPNIDHNPHKELEELIQQECAKYDIRLLKIPQYYYLDKDEVLEYKKIFSNESLLIRSTADLFLVGKAKTILLDCKTTYRKDTGNISIELSSYYWGLQHNRDSIEFYYVYKDDETNKIKIFAPRENPPDCIFIQPRWQKYTAIERLFHKYAETILHYFKNRPIIIYTLHETKGSHDPFILKNKKDLKNIEFTDYLIKHYQKPLFDYLPIRVPFLEELE